jgi:halocyanin-like protein
MDGAEPPNWSRRAVLTTTGAIGALAVAGCVSEDGPDDGTDPGTDDESTDPEPSDGSTEQGTSDEGGSDPPTAVVEAFFEAYERGDVDGMNALIHGDSEMEPIEESSVEEDTEFAELDAKTVEKGDGEAVVELLVTVESAGGETTTRPTLIELRRDDGEWLIWSLETEYEGDNTRVPNAEFSFEGVENGTEIVHVAGDTVRADRLYIRGDGLESTGSWASLGGQASGDAGGNPAVRAGDSIVIETAESYSISLLWETDEGRTVLITSVAASTGSEGTDAPPTDQGVEAYLAGTDNFDGEIADRTGSEEVTVTLGETPDGSSFGFSPPAIRVDPGTTVVWEVEEAVHTVTGVDGAFDSGILEPGDSWDHTFEEPGEYLYLCRPHAGIGMRGAVVVGDSE